MRLSPQTLLFTDCQCSYLSVTHIGAPSDGTHHSLHASIFAIGSRPSKVITRLINNEKSGSMQGAEEGLSMNFADYGFALFVNFDPFDLNSLKDVPPLSTLAAVPIEELFADWDD